MSTFIGQLVGFALIVFLVVRYVVPPVRRMMTNQQEIRLWASQQDLETRRTILETALNLEAQFDLLRDNDDGLCRGGTAEMAARMAAWGNKPLIPLANPPGVVGTTYGVPQDLNFHPQFLERSVWRPRQQERRKQLRASFSRMLALDGVEAAKPAG